MPTVTAHAPGSFCWPELASPDVKASADFYTKLFGWTVSESKMDSIPYYTFLLGGREAGAMYHLTPEAIAQGTAPNWGAYVSVESADATAARAKAAGGDLRTGPFDLKDSGRLAILRDPLGAPINLWQPGSHAGVGVIHEPGALGWTQLNARDPKLAKAFYPEVFGWTAQDMPMGEGLTYTTWLKSDGPAGGMLPMPPDVPAAAPSHWLSYFCVASVEDGHAKAVALGAKSYVGPTEIPGGGKFAVLGDPQGATFGIMVAM